MRKRIKVGEHVRNQCKRHLSDLERRDIFFDEDAANFAIDFFPSELRLSDSHFAGQPFVLDQAQKFIIGSIFGWKRTDPDAETGRIVRRYNRIFIEMGKGNGKSPLLAGIGLFCLTVEGEEGAQIFVAASMREQSRIVFQDAVNMVAQSPELDKRIYRHGENPVQRLSYKPTKSYFVPWSKEQGKTGSGFRPYVGLIDEVHELKDGDIIQTLERGFKFRDQPLLVMATNSGSDRNSACYAEHEMGVQVASGAVQMDNLFPYICSVDDHDPITDEACWIMANPMLGKIVKRERIREAVAQAAAMPSYANSVRRLHFCVWTESDVAWVKRETWESVEDHEMTETEFRGQRCWFGIDLSANTDFTAVARIYRDGLTDEGKPKFAVFASIYTPADTVYQRSRADKAPYYEWVKDGWLTAVPGEMINYDYVAYDLVQAAENCLPVCIAYDQRYYPRFDEAIAATGKSYLTVEHPQGFGRSQKSGLSMPSSIQVMEELIFEKRIRVAYNPVIRLAVQAAQFRENPQMLRFFEKRDSKSRIDVLVAITMGLGAAMAGIGRVAGSPWKDKGFSIDGDEG